MLAALTLAGVVGVSAGMVYSLLSGTRVLKTRQVVGSLILRAEEGQVAVILVRSGGTELGEVLRPGAWIRIERCDGGEGDGVCDRMEGVIAAVEPDATGTGLERVAVAMEAPESSRGEGLHRLGPISLSYRGESLWDVVRDEVF